MRRHYGTLIGAALLAFFVPCVLPASAKAAGTSNVAVIANDSFQTVRGSLHVNEAAGDANAQGNVAEVIRGSSHVQLHIQQRTGAPPAIGGASASIRDSAFADVSGLVQINQTAGSGNAQGNLAIVRVSVPAQVLSDDTLAGAMPVQTVTKHGLGSTLFSDNVDTAATTLHGKGIVQINQSAGTGNATANGFLLQTAQGVTH